MTGLPLWDTITRRKAPAPADTDARAVWAALAGRPRTPLESLVAALNAEGIPKHTWTPRRVRAAVRAADGLIVSGPGSAGYSRVCDIPASEGIRCARKRQSQGWDMVKYGGTMQTMAKLYGLPEETQ